MFINVIEEDFVCGRPSCRRGVNRTDWADLGVHEELKVTGEQFHFLIGSRNRSRARQCSEKKAMWEVSKARVRTGKSRD
jgi:hypothetical protein